MGVVQAAALTRGSLPALPVQLHCHTQMLVQMYVMMARDPDPQAQEVARQVGAPSG